MKEIEMQITSQPLEFSSSGYLASPVLSTLSANSILVGILIDSFVLLNYDP